MPLGRRAPDRPRTSSRLAPEDECEGPRRRRRRL
jgi:hypothetical protein